MSAKEQALEAIRRLPARVSFKAIAQEIDVLAAIRQAEQDVQQGRVYQVEEVRKMLPKWISRS